jgi:hypothetical protein
MYWFRRRSDDQILVPEGFDDLWTVDLAFSYSRASEAIHGSRSAPRRPVATDLSPAVPGGGRLPRDMARRVQANA